MAGKGSKIVRLNVGGVRVSIWVADGDTYVHFFSIYVSCVHDSWSRYLSLQQWNFTIQEVFATSSTTLLSAGETFFTSLLSGKYESEKDETGAIFIDRKPVTSPAIYQSTCNVYRWMLSIPYLYCSVGSPKYFDPILHYLRTNSLEIPSGVSRTSLRNEAEFYGIQKIVDHLDHLEKERAKKELPKKGRCALSLLNLNLFHCPHTYSVATSERCGLLCECW